MLQEFSEAFLLIFIAEMGDKSQLLAMAFATRYPIRKVMLGILIGAIFNNALAVLLGSLVSTFLPMKTIHIIAGFVFIIFALWTLKPEEDDDESEKKFKLKLGPLLTVAIAYFVGEFGDKTQLTAITLASQSNFPFAVLVGTVIGMFSTGGIGILIGRKLGDKLPEPAIRLASSAVFLFFGITRLIDNLPEIYLTMPNILLFLTILLSVVIIMARPLIITGQQRKETAFIRRSKELHDYYKRIKQDFDSICLGAERCKMCQGNRCIVGYTKTLIQYGLNDEFSKHYGGEINTSNINKPFSRQQAMESLLITLEILRTYPSGEDIALVNEIRRNLEMIIFGKSIQEINDWDKYESQLLDINETVAVSLMHKFDYKKKC